MNAGMSVADSDDRTAIAVVHRVLLEIRPDYSGVIGPGDLLVEDWRFDSVDLLELITALEEAADVDLHEGELTLPALNDVADACALYEELRSLGSRAER